MSGSVRFVALGAEEGSEATRLGGQPSWLAEPQWPVSKKTGDQMWFIGQFRSQTPEGDERLAYLFMTNAAGYADDTWEYDAGENAVIVQPGGVVPSFVSVSSASVGPTCGSEAFPESSDEPEHQHNRLGGAPAWLQADETPDGDWRLAAQLDSLALPFPVNFGDAGWGYMFVSPDGSEGRFLWQCS